MLYIVTTHPHHVLPESGPLSRALYAKNIVSDRYIDLLIETSSNAVIEKFFLID